MEFTSQICTSFEQSEQLLALGLKAETADCFWISNTSSITGKTHCRVIVGEFEEDDRCVPAWSLHRLIELCGIDRLPICFGKKGKVRIRVSHIHPTHDGRSGYNHYDSLIDCIEWLITEGHFNKEYLEE